MKCSCGNSSKKQCRALFDEILVKEFSNFRYAKVHRLTVDAYSLQHPGQYMISAKSYAAHLTGLCVAMEYEGSPELLRILFRWRSDHVEFVLAGTHEEIKRYLKR